MNRDMSGSVRGLIDDMLSGSVAGNIKVETSGGSIVTITPTLESGTKIADFTIDETSGVLYAPTPESPIVYTAGDNIQISEENVISATDTTYTAGDNITIENNVISADIPTPNPTATLLWEGDFVGSGTIVVPNLSDWLLVGYCNYTGVDKFVYMSIGSPSRGGSLYGQYQANTMTTFAHRIGFNESTNTLTIDGNNRGLYFNNSTTYLNDSSCHIYSIYGLVKKPTT